MKKRTKFVAGLACLLSFLVTGVSAMATNETAVVEHVTAGQEIALYVKGAPESWDEITCQVGTNAATVESTQKVSGTAESVRTLVLWDNSLSVMKKYGEDIKSILIDVVANRAPNEKFAIATIDEAVTLVADYTDDYTVLKQTIEAIEGENKDAYIIENVYEAVLSLNAVGDCGYKRIILISDGMDATEIGYSKEELNTLLSQTPYPIYTIGVLSKDRQQELQDMFALSRTTYADYFYLNEIEDAMEVVRGFSTDYGLLQVKISVPAELRDGSTQNSQLTIAGGSDSYVATSLVTLPFAESEGGETVPEETAGTTEPAVTEEEPSDDRETSAGAEEPSIAGIPFKWILIGGGALLVVIVIVVIPVVSGKKKKKSASGNDYARLDQQIRNERSGSAPQPQAAHPIRPVQARPAPAQPVQPARVQPVQVPPVQTAQKTQMINTGSAPQAGRETNFLFSGAAAPAHRVVLTNVQDAVKSYQCGMADKIVIGRDPAGCSLVLEDSAVSGRHCEIGLSGTTFYVKDLGSSNGTFINGCRINPNVMTEIRTGCTMKLGRIDYRVTVE